MPDPCLGHSVMGPGDAVTAPQVALDGPSGSGRNVEPDEINVTTQHLYTPGEG